MSNIENTIDEYLKTKNISYKALILEKYNLSKNDIDKAQNFKIIVNKLKKTNLLTTLLPELLTSKFDEIDFLCKAIRETNLVSYLLNNYKKVEELLRHNEISIDEFSYSDSYMNSISLLREITLESGSYITKYSKQRKKLSHLDLHYNLLFKHYINHENLYEQCSTDGLIYGFNHLINNIDSNLKTNEKDLVRMHLMNYQPNTKDQFINNNLIKYIMSSNEINPFIKQMQNFIRSKYSDYLNKIKLEQKFLHSKINKNNINLDVLTRYCMNANITGEILDINLSNTLIKKHLQGEIKLNRHIFIGALRSICNEYLKTNGLANYSFLVKKSNNMNRDVGGYCSWYNRTIVLNDDYIEAFLFDNNIGVFSTLFHELTHTTHLNRMNDYNDYEMRKEMMITNYYPKYYEENYDFEYIEIDARSKGLIEAIRYLKQLDSNIGLKYEQTVIKEIERENQILNLNIADYKNSPYERYKDEETIDEIFEKLIKKHPKIIRKNKIFRLEYDWSGTKKSLKSKCMEYNSLNENEKKIQKKLLKNNFSCSLIRNLQEIEKIIDIQSELVNFYIKLFIDTIVEKNIKGKYVDEVFIDFIIKHDDDIRYQNIIGILKRQLTTPLESVKLNKAKENSLFIGIETSIKKR